METVDLCSSGEESCPNSPFVFSNNNPCNGSPPFHSSNNDFDNMECEPSNNSDSDILNNEYDEEGDRFTLPMTKSCSFFTDSLSETSLQDGLTLSESESDVHIPIVQLQSNIEKDTLDKEDINNIDKGIKYSKTKNGKKRKKSDNLLEHDKEQKKIERKTNKDLKNKEKALKKVENESQRCLKPGVCMKYTIPEINSLILQKDFSNEIIKLLQSNGVSYEKPSFAPENTIGWVRRLPKYSVDEEGNISIETECVREPFLLVLYDMSEMEHLLKTKTLNYQISQLKAATCCQVSVLLYGAKSYFMKKKTSGKKQKKDNQLGISENDLDYYITKLLFEESASCFKVNSPEELAQTVLQFTKSVAEEPYKKQKQSVDEKADFYMRGDNKKCVKVDAMGNGLLQLWCQFLTKFPLISLEKAHAICEKFTSPVSLIQELQKNSTDDGIKILADIPVKRAAGSCSSSRCIGPELARKIHIYFMSEDGEKNLI